MNRQEKLDTIKDLMRGTISLNSFKVPIKVDRLTINEKTLLYTICTNPDGTKKEKFTPLEEECWEYYRQQSHKRPPSREEIRGYAHTSDANFPVLIIGSDAIVRKWLQRLNTAPRWELRNCEPTNKK